MRTILEVEARTASGKTAARQLRKTGMIPGICYGGGGEPFPMSVSPDALSRVLKSPRGRNAVVELELDGKRHHVMVQAVQRDPVRRGPIHVDFRVVRDSDVVTVRVPIRAVGKSAGEEEGGSLVLIRRTVGVKCKVSDIPDNISHDVILLEIRDIVRVSELNLPAGCSLDTKTDYVILQIAAPRVVEEVVVEGEEGEEGEEGAEGAAAATEGDAPAAAAPKSDSSK
jgi:large subunit ribosomal protein L25